MLFGHLLAHALGHTRGGQFFNAVMMLAFVAALPVASVVGFSVFAWNEFAKESDYQRRFGPTWKAQYQAEEGSLTTARTKVAAAMLGAAVNTFLGIVFYRHLIPALRGVGYATRPRRVRLRKRSGLSKANR